MATTVPETPKLPLNLRLKQVDEKVSLQLRHLAEDAVLRGSPCGGERCNTCLYYSDHVQQISYCHNVRLRILVGENWWCQWWQPQPNDDD